MFFKSISLVIDDKKEDGEFISSYLNKNYIPNIFHCYDSENSVPLSEKLTGVRTIFQDLSLISTSSPTPADFDAAAETIENLIDINNGPWLLITWSTWAESESESDFAVQLFEHLHNELPPTLKPYDYITIDKSLFTVRSPHGTVDAPTPETLEQLQQIIEAKLATSHGLKYLIKWEHTAKNAIHSAISELTLIANGTHQGNDILHKVIHTIAESASGKRATPVELNAGTSEILSDIVKDKIEFQTYNSTAEFEFIISSSQENTSLNIDSVSNWKERINKAIHFEISDNIISSFRPGIAYNINDNVIGTGIPSFPEKFTSQNELNKFKRKIFFDFLSTEKDDASFKDELCNRATLICVDITPPCDHANKKSEWNKYIVGLKLNDDDEQYCRFIKRWRVDSTKMEDRDMGGKLLNDSLIFLPKFLDGTSESRVVLNSKLTFSIPYSSVNSILQQKQIFRVRENLLSDIRSWFIRQTTRPGIVELRS